MSGSPNDALQVKAREVARELHSLIHDADYFQHLCDADCSACRHISQSIAAFAKSYADAMVSDVDKLRPQLADKSSGIAGKMTEHKCRKTRPSERWWAIPMFMVLFPFLIVAAAQDYFLSRIDEDWEATQRENQDD